MFLNVLTRMYKKKVKLNNELDGQLPILGLENNKLISKKIKIFLYCNF